MSQSVESICTALKQHRLLRDDSWKVVTKRREEQKDEKPESFTQWLLAQKVFTPYQVDFCGRTRHGGCGSTTMRS